MGNGFKQHTVSLEREKRIMLSRQFTESRWIVCLRIGEKTGFRQMREKGGFFK